MNGELTDSNVVAVGDLEHCLEHGVAVEQEDRV